ncbi:MAG TPA: formylglycine-generating enzyme family protein [Bryobacteraceae bacterium]|nr:formylglycine-generating enzyme family protein [Bryobacteraceae bacterium]
MIPAFLLLSSAALALAQPPEFVTIPAGSFIMGCESALPCSKTLPKKLVTIERPFQLSKYEVTVGQFRAFVKATGYVTDAEKAGDARTWRSPGFTLSKRQPVVFMTLNDAAAYCSFIGARVPFEAEWEYAARAGSATHHYWGEEIDGRYLWYFDNTDERPMPVGRKLPNAWGLFDMEGNAMEWVRDAGPHSSITRAGAGSLRGGSYAMCPEPYPPSQGIRQRFIWLGPTFPGSENSNFRRDERRFDFGIRCAR